MSSDQHGHSHGPGEQCHGHGAAGGDAHGHGHGGAPDMLPAGLLPGGGVPPQVAQMVAMLGPEQRAALQARMMQMMAANKAGPGPSGAPGVPNPEMMSQVMKLMSQGNMMSGASPFGGGPPGLGGPPGMGGPPNPAMMAQMAQMMQARGQHGHGHGGPPGMGNQPTPAMMAQMAQMMQARMSQQAPPLVGSSSSSSSSSSTEIVSKADGQSRYAHSVLDSSTDVNTVAPAASPMEYSAHLYEPSPQDEAPIITAAKRGDVKEMDRLLQDDPDFDMTVTDEQGNTALHWAVYGGHLEASSWLITSGSPLDPTNKIANATPLHWACTAGNIRIVQLLVKSGADINAVDAKGYNALIHATHYNDGMLVYYLQRQGLPIDSTDNLGHTPLHWAAYLGHSRLVQMILSLGANIDKTDSTGNTALHLAASKGALEAMEVLLTRGANHTIRNNNNQTADEHAERSGFFSTAEVLRTRAHHLRSLSTTTGQRNQSALWFTVGFSFVMTLIYLFTNFPAWFAFSLSFMLFYLAKVSLQHKRPSTFSGDTLGIGIAHAIFLLTFYAFFSFISPHLEWFEGIGFALLFGVTYLLFNFVAYVQDPGFIPRTGANTIHAVLENIEKGGRVPQYCMANMIAKPLRAEYSPATGRCVARYDHHSTWLNKPIGWLNYRYYLSLCVLLTVLHVWFIRVASILLFSYENGPEAWRPFATSFWFFSHVAPFVFYMVLVNGGLLVWRLLGLYAIYNSIKSNMTTNEVNNSRSINYMKGPGGSLFNPFLRRTFKENFADFWRGNFNYLHIYFVTEEEFGSSLRLAAVQSPV